MINFVEYAKSGLILVVITLVLLIAFRFRDRILVLFTGDDRIHMDWFDCLWMCCCQCCGNCTCDWTRLLCCGSLRGKNLVRLWGQWIGVYQHSLSVTNIVVGDLPTDSPADFYVQFEVGEHPPINSNIAPFSNPKLVRFRGETILLVRDSTADNAVKVSVKSMHVFGHTDICYAHIAPHQLVQWARQQGVTNMQDQVVKGPIRLQMSPESGGGSMKYNLPAWILFEVNVVDDDVDSAINASYAAIDIDETSTGTPRTFETVKDFKHSYPLYDSRGATVHEPSEDVNNALDHYRSFKRRTMKSCCTSFWVVAVFMVLTRMIVFGCFRNYKKYTVLAMHGVEFPILFEKKDWILMRCGYDVLVDIQDVEYQATCDWQRIIQGRISLSRIMRPFNLPKDKLHFDREAAIKNKKLDRQGRIIVNGSAPECLPTDDQVISFCHNFPTGFTPPRLWTMEAGSSPFCGPWTCETKPASTQVMLIYYALAIVWVVLIALVYIYLDTKINNLQRDIIRGPAKVGMQELVTPRTIRETTN